MTNKIIFSNGDASGDSLSCAALPLAGWNHIMGSIDATIGQATIYINGFPAVISQNTTGTVPFTNVPTLGKFVYIGNDGGVNFFTGDIADLSIWYDVSWAIGGIIPPSIIANFIKVTQGVGKNNQTNTFLVSPVDPLIGVFISTLSPAGTIAGSVLPDVFLNGPIQNTLVPTLQGGRLVSPPVLPLGITTGGIQDSTDNPVPIFVSVA